MTVVFDSDSSPTWYLPLRHKRSSRKVKNYRTKISLIFRTLKTKDTNLGLAENYRKKKTPRPHPLLFINDENPITNDIIKNIGGVGSGEKNKQTSRNTC